MCHSVSFSRSMRVISLFRFYDEQFTSVGRIAPAEMRTVHAERLGQRHEPRFVALQSVVAVTVGVDVAADFAAHRPLTAQLLSAHGGELRYDALQRFLFTYLPEEAPRYGNLLLLGRHLLKGDALHALQLIPHAKPRDAHPGMHPFPGQLHELQGRSDVHAVEHSAVAAADAPDVAQQKYRKHLLDVLFAAAPVEAGTAFGELRGDFCQRLRRGGSVF